MCRRPTCQLCTKRQHLRNRLPRSVQVRLDSKVIDTNNCIESQTGRSWWSTCRVDEQMMMTVDRSHINCINGTMATAKAMKTMSLTAPSVHTSIAECLKPREGKESGIQDRAGLRDLSRACVGRGELRRAIVSGKPKHQGVNKQKKSRNLRSLAEERIRRKGGRTASSELLLGGP